MEPIDLTSNKCLRNNCLFCYKKYILSNIKGLSNFIIPVMEIDHLKYK